jgi:hypothetical protein
MRTLWDPLVVPSFILILALHAAAQLGLPNTIFHLVPASFRNPHHSWVLVAHACNPIARWKAETRKIAVTGQTGQKSFQDPILTE